MYNKQFGAVGGNGSLMDKSSLPYYENVTITKVHDLMPHSENHFKTVRLFKLLLWLHIGISQTFLLNRIFGKMVLIFKGRF